MQGFVTPFRTRQPFRLQRESCCLEPSIVCPTCGRVDQTFASAQFSRLQGFDGSGEFHSDASILVSGEGNKTYLAGAAMSMFTHQSCGARS
jgi:hypothetical protein